MGKDYKNLNSSKVKSRKNKNCDKEYTKVQKLAHENKKLKKQVAQLRKAIKQIDIERYHDIKEIITQHEYQNQEMKEDAKAEKAWKCYQCDSGVMRLKITENRAGAKYYRKCDMCSNRTKAKEYTKDVEGV